MRAFDSGLLAEARALHDEILVVNGLDASEFNEPLVDNLYAGGVDANLMTGLRLGERPLIRPGSPHLRFVREQSDRLVHAKSVRDIRAARAEGKVAIVFGWQSPEYLEEDLERLEGFHHMGIRSVGLVYNVGSFVGSGCVDPEQGPLSHFGVELVHRLEELRIVVDVGGHTSEATSFDAIRVARRPVLCSHTNPRALRDNPRAMTDDLFREIARTGGVIGITAFNFFLVEEGRGTVDHFLDHIDYAVGLVGAEHVALGLDQIIGREISGPANPRRFPPEAYPERYEDWIYPEELTDFTGVPLITAGLIERGYGRRDIELIMGENWLRVWEELWEE
jgi:membrane dipeptidase